MQTMLSKLFLSAVFSTVLVTALSLSTPASASTGRVSPTMTAPGAGTRVVAEGDKKADDKKTKGDKADGKADGKKGADKKDKAPAGGW
jgi:hypothetical protein